MAKVQFLIPMHHHPQRAFHMLFQIPTLLPQAGLRVVMGLLQGGSALGAFLALQRVAYIALIHCIPTIMDPIWV